MLEVNFTHQALLEGMVLAYGVRQGRSGDIDFGWEIQPYVFSIEMKLLGQDRASRQAFAMETPSTGMVAVTMNDLSDIGRLQRDILQKATTRKFNPTPEPNAINLVGMDVVELQQGTVDVADCLLVARHYGDACLRADVVGVFERLAAASMTREQQAWSSNIPGGARRDVLRRPPRSDCVPGSVTIPVRSGRAWVYLAENERQISNFWRQHNNDRTLGQGRHPHNGERSGHLQEVRSPKVASRGLGDRAALDCRAADHY